jgi:hypothetical protein
MKKFISQNVCLLSPVLLAPLTNFHLQLSPRIFTKKLETIPMGNSGAGETESKISCQTPFKFFSKLCIGDPNSWKLYSKKQFFDEDGLSYATCNLKQTKDLLKVDSNEK